MTSVDVEQFDWLEYMRLYGGNTPEVFVERLDEDWIIGHCLTACDVAFMECPASRVRLNNGELSERLFAYVICSMVLRVARWDRRKNESNGAYTRIDQTMDVTQPGWEISPDLHVTKKERQILEGNPNGATGFGCVTMGLHRVYGM